MDVVYKPTVLKIFHIIKCDKYVVIENDNENEERKIKEILYNLKFIVWKGRYKTVDE